MVHAPFEASCQPVGRRGKEAAQKREPPVEREQQAQVGHHGDTRVEDLRRDLAHALHCGVHV